MKKLLFALSLMLVAGWYGNAYGQYCTTGLYSSGCSFGDEIDDFSLGSYSQTGTGCSTNGFGDYTSDTIDITQTLDYPVHVTANFSSQTIKIWIDFNDDGDFNDAGEEILNSTPVTFGSGTAYNDTINLPQSTNAGIHRMRARVVYFNTTFTACSNQSFGEVHDFTVNVQPNTSGNCASFSNFQVDSISGTAAKLDWTPGATNSSFYFEYGPIGFTPGTGTTITGAYPGSQPPVVLTGLSPQTTYDYYFGEICNSGADSVYFNLVQQFTTTKLCASPTGFSASNTTSNSTDLNWSQAGSVQEYWIFYGNIGFNPATSGMIDTVTTTTHTLTGLNPTSSYDIYLATNCAGGNGISDTVGPININTLIQGPQGVTCASNPGPVTVFSEEFDSQGSWTGDISTSSGEWQLNSGGTGSSGTGPSGAHSGSNYIYFEASASGPAAMVSPPIDLTSAMEQAELAFWMHIYGGDAGYLRIRVSTASATGPFTDTIFYYNQGQLQSSHSGPWQQVGISLDAYLGQTIWLEFEADRSGGFESDFAIDLLTVNTCGDICVNPSALSATNITDTSADLSWTENGLATQWDIEFGPAGFTPTGTPTYSGVTSNPYSVTGLTPTTLYDFYVRSLCGGTSGNSGWMGPFSFATAIQGPQGIICTSNPGPVTVFSEEFDTQGGWTGDISTSSGDWQINSGGTGSSGTGPSGAHSGSNYIYFEASSAGPAAMISPPIDLTSAMEGAELAFWMHAYGADIGYLQIRVSTSSATGPFTDTVFFYNQGQLQTSHSDPWQHVGVNLDAYLGQSIWLEFEADRSGGLQGDIALDSLTLSTCGDICVAPSALTAINITGNSADLSWTENGTATQWDVEVGPAGFTPTGTATHPGVTSNPLTVTGLTPNSPYDFYVRSLCGGTAGNSAWVGPFSFNTALQGPQGVTCTSAPGPINIFADDFEVPAGWTGDLGTFSGQWQYNSGSTGSGSTGPSGAHSGSQYVYFEASGSGPASLISPAIDLTSAVDGAELAFWLHAYGANTGYLRVMVSTTSATGPFTDTVFNYTSGELQTSSSDPWQHIGVDLSAYLGQTIYLEFEADRAGSFTSDISLDLITVQTCGNICVDPSSLSLDSVTETSAYLDWTENGTATQWDVEFGPAGFTPTGTATHPGVTAKPFLITGLNPASSYDFYVRAVCGGAAGNSNWTGPFNFGTLIQGPQGVTCVPSTDTSTVILTEEFDSQGGWTGNISNSSGDWQFNSGSTGSSNTGPNGAHSGSNYIYFEASGSGPASLISPGINLVYAVDGAELAFWLHAYGDDVGYLNVSVSTFSDQGPWTDTLFHYNGQLQTSSSDPWQHVGINLDSYLGQKIWLKFEADRTSSFSGDIALDLLTVEACGTFCLPEIYSINSLVAGVDTALLDIDGSSDNFQIEWGPCGYTQGTGTFLSGANTFTLTGLSANTCYDVYVRRNCGTSGFSGWAGPFSMKTECGPDPLMAPYVENFDGPAWVASGSNSGNEIDVCWIANPDMSQGGEPFKWIPRNSGPSSGNGPLSDLTGGNFMYAEASGSSSSDIAYLTTPLIDVSGLTAPAVYFWQHRYGGTVADMDVEVTNDDGTTWTTVYSVTGEIQSSSSDPWEDEVVNLSGFAGDTIRVRFKQTGNGCCGDVAIDSVAIAEAPTCPAPASINITGVVDTAATFSWMGSSSAADYEVWVGPQGFYQGPATTAGMKGLIGDTITSLTLDSLSSNTCYEFLVRTVCGPGDSSTWTGPVAFCTPCSPFGVPYFEDFDNLSTNMTGDLGNCWNTLPATTSGFTWRTNSGTTSSSSTGPNGDATSGSGIYLYTEASSGSQGDETFVYSPLFDVSGLSAVEMRYAYHMYGATIDSLVVEVDSGSGWNTESLLIGEQQTGNSDPWRLDTVDLSAYTGLIQVRFRAKRGSSFTGDISIDDFIIEEPVPTDLAMVSADFDRNSLCLTTNDTLVFTVANIKGGVYDLSTTPLVVNYDVSGPVNTTGSATFSTGTINPSASGTFTVSGIDLSMPGSYSLEAWLDSSAFNQSPLNDTLDDPSTVTVKEVWNVLPDTVVTITNTTDSVELIAASSFFTGDDFMITEVCHYAGFGTGGPSASWVPDDYIEITGVPNADLDGYTLEQWENGSLDGSFTFGPGTVLSPNGTAVIAIGSGNTSDPANFLYDGRGTAGTWSSGSDAGRILKDPSGNIIDAVGYSGSGGYTFPASSGVTSAQWSGNTASTSGTAGIRLEGPDTDDVTNWTIVTSSNPQDPGVLNTNVPLPAPNSMAGFDWKLNGVTIDTLPETWVGPYTAAGTYNYVATFNSPCGTFSDTVTVIVNLTVTCPAPSNLSASNVTGSSVDLSWTSGGASNWQVEYGPLGFTPGAGTIVNAPSNPFILSGLSAFTSYDIYVRDSCGVADVSTWAGPVSITTVAITCPPVTNLDTTSVGCDSISFSWTSNSGGSVVQYGPTGFVPGQGTFSGIINTGSYTLSGLAPGTTYDVWVADTCTGDTSSFFGPLTVQTASGPLPVASINLLTDSISGSNHYFAFDASGSSGATSYSWDFGNGSTSADTLTLASYNTSGNFTVVLTATNACGTDTDTMVITSTVGMEENALGRSLSVYPNPTQSDVTVEFDPQGSSDAVLRLMDIRGREIIRSEYDNLNGRFREELSLNGLAKGIYMIEIRSGDMRAYRRVNLQ